MFPLSYGALHGSKAHVNVKLVELERARLERRARMGKKSRGRPASAKETSKTKADGEGGRKIRFRPAASLRLLRGRASAEEEEEPPKEELVEVVDLDVCRGRGAGGWAHRLHEGESVGAVGDAGLVTAFRVPPASLVPIRSLVYQVVEERSGEILARKRYGDWAFKVAAAGSSVWVCHWNVHCGLLRLNQDLSIADHFPMIRDAVSPNPELIPLTDMAAALAVYRKDHVKRLHIYVAKTQYKVPIQPTLYVVAGRETSTEAGHGFLFLAYHSYNRNLQTFAVIGGRLQPSLHTFPLPMVSLRKMCAEFLVGGGFVMVYQSDELYDEDTVMAQEYDKTLEPRGPRLRASLPPDRTLSDMTVLGNTLHISITPKSYTRKACVIM